MIVVNLILIGIGLFMIATAIFNWDTWFYNPEADIINIIGGETMVRIYWGISGAVLIIAVTMGWSLNWW